MAPQATQSKRLFLRLVLASLALTMACQEKQEKWPELVWKSRVPGDVLQSVSLYGSQLFVVGNNGRLYAYDKHSGKKKWSQDLHIRWASPVGHHGHVYVGNEEGTLYKVDTVKGHIVWQYQAHGAIETAVIPHTDSLLFLNAKDGLMQTSSYVYMINAAGEEKWSFRTDAEVKAQPLWQDSLLWVMDAKGQLYALTENGQQVFTHDFGVSVSTDPVLCEGYLLFSDEERDVYAFGLPERRLLWRATATDRVSAPVLCHKEVVYAGDWKGMLHAFDLNTGQPLWQHQAQGWFNTAPILRQHTLYVMSAHGHLQTLRLPSRQSGWNIQIKEETDLRPLFEKKHLYLFGLEGAMYKFLLPEDSESGFR